LSSFWSALALLSSRVSCCKRNSEGDWRLGFFFFFLWVEINYLHCSFFWFCGISFLLCRKQTQRWWNPLRKIKKKKKLTLCETLSSTQLRKSCKVLCGRSLSSFWSALALLSSWVSYCKRNSEGD
jgi:hypothetical protein